MARMAKIIGRVDEAQEYDKLAENILEAFNSAFLEDTQYAAIRVSPVDTYPHQTPNALPLYLNMVPENKKDGVLKSLVESVALRQDSHVDTGILGTRYILDVLTDSGQAETAFRMVTHTSYPGWGYMIEEGATTMWERWERLEGPGMNSHNHIMLGSVDAWFYRVLAGIGPLEPGWKTISVRPHVLGDLNNAEAEVGTVRGKVRSSWKKEDGVFSLEISIPVGSEARVAIPLLWGGATVAADGELLWENGRSSGDHPDIILVGTEGQSVVFSVKSGSYHFKVSRTDSGD
jgi:alpha-L-rhamnosidase